MIQHHRAVFEHAAKQAFPEVELAQTESGTYRNTTTRNQYEAFCWGWNAHRSDQLDRIEDIGRDTFEITKQLLLALTEEDADEPPELTLDGAPAGGERDQSQSLG